MPSGGRIINIASDAARVGTSTEAVYSACKGGVIAFTKSVARELGEEAGIQVSAVRYVASQPWPFPSSLMVGCIASSVGRDIILDTVELEDAKWVTRAEVAAAMANAPERNFTAPPPFAIAHTLFAHWLAQAE